MGRRRRIPEATIDRAIALMRAGATLAAAAAEVGVSVGLLSGRIYGRGLSIAALRAPLRPQGKGQAGRLRSEEVDAAIARIAAGDSLTTVAREMGTSRQTLHRHLRRRGLSVRGLRRQDRK